MDDDSSWLSSAFLIYPALSAFLFDAEAAFISLPKASSKLVAHIDDSREHSG